MACEYCKDNKPTCIVSGINTSAYIMRNDLGTPFLKVYVSDTFNPQSDVGEILFCPMCGEKLGDADERA